MGIQAVKGVEIGDGFELAGLRGSQAHDEIVRDERGLHRDTNRAGGIEAGVSNGEEIVARAAIKPLPTLMRPLRTVDLASGEPTRRSSSARTRPPWRPSQSWPRRRSPSSSPAPRARSTAATRSSTSLRRTDLPGADRLAAPIENRHLALIGFMGAGKTTLGDEVARRLGRRFVDLDAEIERHAAEPISTIFATRGEVEFRAIEEKLACEALDSAPPAVISLGGGAMVSKQTAAKLREQAFTVLVEVDVEEAWRRARRAERRPLAESESQFRRLHEQRRPL